MNQCYFWLNNGLIYHLFVCIFAHHNTHTARQLELECSWIREKQIDWIIHGPALAVLAINFVFLIRIMWVSIRRPIDVWTIKSLDVTIKVVYKVLITKLRSANTAETRQYRKASKALLVLIPLLGITYLVLLTGPQDGVLRYIFDVFRPLLLSTQVSWPTF